MIHHVVLLKIRKSAKPAQVRAMFAALAGLRKKIPGLVSFEGGPYSSPEGMHKGYTHGFVMVFRSARARDVYLPHPEHEKVKAKVLALLAGGLDGVVAFDFES